MLIISAVFALYFLNGLNPQQLKFLLVIRALAGKTLNKSPAKISTCTLSEERGRSLYLTVWRDYDVDAAVFGTGLV